MPNTPIVATAMTRRLVPHLRARGVDVDALLVRAGIDPAHVEDSAALTPLARVLHLWELGAEATDDPALGVHVATDATIHDYGVAGFILANHPTLREGMQDGCRVGNVLLAPVHCTLRDSGELTWFEVRCEPHRLGASLLAQDMTTAMFVHARALVGGALQPQGATMRADVSDLSPWEAALGVRPTTAADVDAVAFRTEDLQAGVPGANPQLLEHLHAAVELRVARRREAEGEPDTLLRLSGVTIDLRRGEVVRDTERISLTSKEQQIVRFLAERANELVTHEMLEQQIWGLGKHVISHAPAVAIRRLRQKIEPEPRRPRNLVTVFGEGWKLVVPESGVTAT